MATNRINLAGRLGKDPDFHYIDKNTTVVRLRIAVNDCDYDINGNKGRYTTWITVVLWNRLAYVAKNGLCKGAAIAVEGRLSNNSYVDKEGTKHYQLIVEAERIECLHKQNRPEQTIDTKVEEEKDTETDCIVGEAIPEGEIIADNACNEDDTDQKLSIKDVEMPKKGKRNPKQ